MPRINIEDQFWVDVGEVAAKMGDYTKAVGQSVRWIKFAQDRFREGRRVTREEFSREFDDALIPKFAEVDGNFVRVTGEKKFFGWLTKKQEAGRKGGSTPRNTPEAKPSTTEQTEADDSKAEHSEASSSFSPSSSVLKTHAAVSSSAPPAAPSPQVEPLGEELSWVIPELRGNSRVEEALRPVPIDTQRDWVRRYTRQSVVETLLKGINQSKAGQALISWVERERITLKAVAKPEIPRAEKTRTPWPTHSKDRALGGVTVLEAMRRAKGHTVTEEERDALLGGDHGSAG